MENLRQCSRCKSNIEISYFGLNRKSEPYKTCDNCRNKKKQTTIKTEDGDTSKSSSKPVVKVDDEIFNYVVNLLTKYSTNKLDILMIANNSEHVFAYAETKLNRK